MTRYAKLAGRKPQFSKSSAQEEQERRQDRGSVSDDGKLQLDDAEAGPSSSSRTTSTSAMQVAEPATLLKKVKLMRLKMKKAKTDEKKREWQLKVKDIEQQLHQANGQRGGQARARVDGGGDNDTGDGSGNNSSANTSRRQAPATSQQRTSASDGIANPWKAMEAERRAKADERSSVRREKRITERESSQRCFACREVGHSAKNCPEAIAAAATATEQQTQGAVSSAAAASQPLVCCYRCGSTEHTLAKCRRLAPRVGSELPFAHCFICQERGHLASKCAQNKGRGIYPMGGTCMLCQSVEHLAKDCPINEAQRTGGSTAASNAVIGWADVHKDSHRGADEDDFHAVSRKRHRENNGGGNEEAHTARHRKHIKVVSF